MVKRILGAAVVALACITLLSSCSLLSQLPGGTLDDPDQKADAAMQHIADAVKNDDVLALEKLFSPAARKVTPDLGNELKYFISAFPSGVAKWIEPDGGCGGSGNNDPDHSADSWLASCGYTATVDGRKYDVFFRDVTEDTGYRDFVGVYALGVARDAATTGYEANGAPKPFNLWASSEGLNDFDFFEDVPNSFTGVPGVYRPGVPGTILRDTAPAPAVEMQKIADAVKNHDAAALEKLFSPRARKKSTELVKGLKYFLSVFPSGHLTWKPEGSLTWQMQDNIPACDFKNGATIATATEELCPVYRVAVNGKYFDLDFIEYSVDQPDTDKVGLYALGVAPYTGRPGTASSLPKQFSMWAKSYVLTSGTPGIYVP